MSKDFSKHFIREQVIQRVRQFFIGKGFHEVDVPLILPQLPLEPNLYPLKTTWQQKKLDFYLITSPESSLKKLITQGIGDCFSIAKVFRDLEDIGPTHNLEFTMLEWYEIGKNYLDIARTTQDLIRYVNQSSSLIFQGRKIDLSSPWYEFTLQELFQKFAGIDLSRNLTLDRIKVSAKNKGYNTDGVTEWEPLYTQIFINEIESKLPADKPCIIYDYPTQLSPLCQPCQNNPGFSQRFEFYIGGMEIGNAYSELTDPSRLEENFQKETEVRKKARLPYHPYDKKLIESLKHFPACGGIGLGIDRLAMLMADTDKISDIVYFPTSELINKKN